MNTEWLDGFELWLTASGRTAQTVSQYRFCARRFVASLDGEGITRGAITRHRASMGRRSAAYQTTNFSALKAFLRYLREEEGLDVPEMTGKPPRVPMPDIQVPADDDVRALLKACRSARDKAIVRVLASTGLRLSECTGIRVEDVDLSPRAAMVAVMGKGRKPRQVPLDASTNQAIRKYLRDRQRSPWARSPMLWLGSSGPLASASVARIVRRAAGRAGVDIHTHQLRHYYCHVFQAGEGTVTELAHLAGWSNLNQSMRYARATLGERAEQRARALAIGDRL